MKGDFSRETFDPAKHYRAVLMQQGRVRQAMESGRDNVTVRLAQPIPVFIVYGTALAHPDGEVHFYDDIYGHDPKLTAALAKANP